MSNYRIKGLPPIKLNDLLKKRGLTLKDFLKNMGIATYTTLVQQCQSMGVSCPSEQDFKDALGDVVSSPQEGVVVLDPPTLTKDSGQKINIDEFSTFPKQESVETLDPVQEQQEDVVQVPVKTFKRTTKKTSES